MTRRERRIAAIAEMDVDAIPPIDIPRTVVDAIERADEQTAAEWYGADCPPPAAESMMWLTSGRLVDPWNLAPALASGRVTLEDIAHSLARIHRWTGHTHDPISVGAHTLICAEAARRQSRRLGLLALHHEDGEAFFNDLPWAIKRHPAMVAYRGAEHRATRECVDWFCPSLRGVDLAAIKPIDTACVMWEAERFLPRDRDRWDHPAPEPPLVPETAYWQMTPNQVALVWLKWHAALTETIAEEA